MKQGLIDILTKARKQAKERGELSPYSISCMTLIAILEELENAQDDLDVIPHTASNCNHPTCVRKLFKKRINEHI